MPPALGFSIMETDHAELVRAAADGDAAAWNTIIDRYAGLVWTVARGLDLSAADAADVSQTTWLRLVENLHTIREPAGLGAWLATTARREALVMLRKRREVPVTYPVAFAGDRTGRQLRRGRRGAGHAGRQPGADPGALPGYAPPPPGRTDHIGWREPCCLTTNSSASCVSCWPRTTRYRPRWWPPP